jgi:hypothetical protein
VYKKNGIEDKDVDVLASAETELLESTGSILSGKGIFTSFLKSYWKQCLIENFF